MARGYYTRTTLTAWNWRDGQLTQLWKFDSNTTPRDSMSRPYTGQGAHSLSVANVDDDPAQEIIYGAMTVDHNGAGCARPGYNHGDALHVGDFIPSRARRRGVHVQRGRRSTRRTTCATPSTCAIIQAVGR